MCTVRCSALLVLVVFFFFQAEDGIRDKLVTGVQTCALPIWSSLNRPQKLRSLIHVAKRAALSNTSLLVHSTRVKPEGRESASISIGNFASLRCVYTARLI